MNDELSQYYLRWAVIILIGSLIINIVTFMLLSSRFTTLRKEITLPQKLEATGSPMLQAQFLPTAATPSALNAELTAIKDELVRLRAEQRDINRILELPVSPREIVTIISNYQTSTGSATKP